MADDEKKRTVKVACRVPNGLTIRLFGPSPSQDPGGARPMVAKSPPLDLRGPATNAAGAGAPTVRTDEAVINEGIDEEFMREWLLQNEKNPLVVQGLVSVVEEREEQPEGEPE